MLHSQAKTRGTALPASAVRLPVKRTTLAEAYLSYSRKAIILKEAWRNDRQKLGPFGHNQQEEYATERKVLEEDGVDRPRGYSSLSIDGDIDSAGFAGLLPIFFGLAFSEKHPVGFNLSFIYQKFLHLPCPLLRELAEIIAGDVDHAEQQSFHVGLGNIF